MNNETTTATEQELKNSYGYLTDRLIKIFCIERLTQKVTLEFKQNLKTLKDNYGVKISKEYFKPFFKRNSDDFRQRVKRILQKSELKTEQHTRYKERMTSKAGVLYMEHSQEELNFFLV